MDEQRRLAYLRAMGITPWVPRHAIAEPALWAQSRGQACSDDRESGSPAVAREETVTRPDPAGAASPEVRTAAPPTQPAPPRKPAWTGPTNADPAAMDWDALQTTVAGCRACGLCETRTQTVFGVGDREARLLVIGEAPGADEDRQGEPFVGRAGQLLNRMLAAIGLPRERVYIANILKCRPPGNRDPRPDEVLACAPFLARQLALIRPKLILAAGRISAQTLLCTDVPVGKLRGRWHAYGPQGLPLRVTYHPAYLLRSPEQKGRAWEDLCAVARRLAE